MCTWRLYTDGNRTHVGTYTVYAVELLLHELFLQSEHRTFDPEEADFFYVPIHATCFIFPIHSWADGPWWYAPGGALSFSCRHGARLLWHGKAERWPCVMHCAVWVVAWQARA